MSFSQKIIERATAINRSLVLPESGDARVLQAAALIQKRNIASRICLIGSEEEILQNLKAKSIALNMDNIDIVNPLTDSRREDFARSYYQKRRHRGVSEEQAYEHLGSALSFSAMLVHQNYYHAMVAGALHTTADVLRAALQIIGAQPGLNLVSSAFIIEQETPSLGADGCLVFSDCAIIPRPGSDDLAQIALAAASTCKLYLETVPRIAMLSFSTLGSAEHEEAHRVRAAVEQLRRQDARLIVDGEMQMDAALRPDVAALKAGQSAVAGKANTLIFPDLASGNIAYKTAQIFGRAAAYGPIIQGLAAPVSDLSRGCSAEEIVIAAGITLVQDRDNKETI